MNSKQIAEKFLNLGNEDGVLRKGEPDFVYRFTGSYGEILAKAHLEAIELLKDSKEWIHSEVCTRLGCHRFCKELTEFLKLHDDKETGK